MSADRQRPPTAGLEIQGHWESAALQASWPTGADTHHVLGRLRAIVIDRTFDGAAGPVLEVAAAEAEHACRLSELGLRTVVLEPSPTMLEQGRANASAAGVRVDFVRGIAEALPYRDATFDRVLIESAVDHLASPDLGLREMTRVLKPDGRLVISAVNYRGLSVRVSRLLYRIARQVGLLPKETKLFWDSPVPLEHTFECSPAALHPVCEQYLQLDRLFGVSLGWGVPGWGRLLERLPPAWRTKILAFLDRVAARWPAVADYSVSVWRPRPTPMAPAVADTRHVRPVDPAYQWKARAEQRWWTQFFSPGIAALFQADQRFINVRFTGDQARTWLDDLMARGPFERAALLGCDDAGLEVRWVAADASRRLDVYELTPAVIERVAASLRRPNAVHFARTDLNFARLPEAAYDVVWSSGTLHHLVNLEHVCAEVERALRDGGLFALHDYVGEPRRRLGAERVARAAAVLREIPPAFRHGQVAELPELPTGSPMCGVRSDEILAAVRERFDVVHEALGAALLPLLLVVDLDRLEREEPRLLADLFAAEDEAMREFGPCVAYGVYRKRS